MKRALTGALIGLAVAGAGCRGAVSEDPPIHVIGDMDWQQKYLPEQESSLFPDGRAMRPLVEGTVAQGQLREDDAYFRGKTADGAFIQTVPIPVDEATLRRGQDRFNIYCAPCHDQAGSGHGLVIKRGYPLPPNLADDRIRNKPDGDIFNTITNGNNNMPSYKKQIPVEDRWKIVTWVRALGHSQHATTNDVPSEQRDRIDAESGTP